MESIGIIGTIYRDYRVYIGGCIGIIKYTMETTLTVTIGVI